MGRRRKIVLAALAAVVVLAAIAWVERPRDEPAKATVGEAVEKFREESDKDDADRDGGRREPALGVYRYATTGEESVKASLIGTTHDYYGVSTIVLSDGRCGQRERWQVLDGRWSEAEACPAKGRRASATVIEFHEFFETGQEDVFHCRSEPVSIKPGSSFASSCESEEATIESTSRVVGIEPVGVGTETFDAVHVSTESVLGGSTDGSSKRDEWRRRSDGLLLKRQAESEADVSTAGGSHYTEHYKLRLLSTEPRR